MTTAAAVKYKLVPAATTTVPADDNDDDCNATTAATPPLFSIPTTMKCIVYGTERYAWGNQDGDGNNRCRVPPTGRAGHVLVKVVAAGLNPVDAKNVVGDKLPESWTTLQRWIRRYVIYNNVPGFDFAGICMEQVDCSSHWSGLSTFHQEFKVGDHVFGIMPPFGGTLAEYISVPLHQVCHMPQTKDTTSSALGFVEAAALPLVGLTALQALKPHIVPYTSPSLPASSVLVIGGSGGTGHVALQVAKCLAESNVTTATTTTSTESLVVATVCSTRNVDFCRSMGATHIVDYTKCHTKELLHAELLQMTRQQGIDQTQRLFDVVLDCVSSADLRDQGMDYPSLLQKQQPLLVRPESYVYRRLGGRTIDWIRAGLERFLGPQSWLWHPNTHARVFWIRMHQTAHELQQLSDWAATVGKLSPHVAQTYDFTPNGVQEAMDALLSRRVQGKVVVLVSPLSLPASTTTTEDEPVRGSSNES